MSSDVREPTCRAGLPGRARRRRKGRTIGRLTGVAFAGVLGAGGVAFLIGLVHFAGSIANFERPATVRNADGIVALTGGAARISDAMDLLELGHANRLLITGVHPRNTADTLASMAPGRDTLFSCCVDLGYTALNTVGNAKEARNWARDHGYNSLIVVTSSYHLPRSLNELRREMPEATLIPHPVISDNLPLDSWWRNPGTTKLLLSEYVKYLMSILRLRWRPSTTIETSLTTAVAGD
jgi:uncharacterized SAM-binding protein YcdF (DUF218 family)